MRKGVALAAGTAAGAALGVAAGAAAGFAAWRTWQAMRPHGEDLAGRVAFITGGSRGLGLQLARDLAAQGCRLVICARDADELERARQDLERRGADVWAVECDVTDRARVEQVVLEAIGRFGSLDIVVANAGVIQVGPIESMRVEDFEEAMDVMFWGAFNVIWAALPLMRERRSGHIVTITSIGGKIAVPHLVPYSCAKFAAVALSEGLRAELAPRGIRVLTVVPGLMRTGSFLNAQFKGRQESEFAWFGLGASLPGMSMSVERSSAQIVRAIRSGKSHQILTAPAQLAARFHGAFPQLSSRILELVNRVLPSGDGSHEKISGHDANRRLHSRIHRMLTALGHRAAREMNELGPA